MSSTRELCEARQIPVTDAYPGVYYIATLCMDDDSIDPSYRLWGSASPTECELDLIASYIEHVCVHSFGAKSHDDYVRRYSPDRAPYATVKGGHNTVTFLKRGDGDWGFRRMTYRSGPTFYPQPSTGDGPMVDLLAVLDRVCGRGSWEKPEPWPDWLVWKATHPEVFAAQVSSS